VAVTANKNLAALVESLKVIATNQEFRAAITFWMTLLEHS